MYGVGGLIYKIFRGRNNADLELSPRGSERDATLDGDEPRNANVATLDSEPDEEIPDSERNEGEAEHPAALVDAGGLCVAKGATGIRSDERSPSANTVASESTDANQCDDDGSFEGPSSDLQATEQTTDVARGSGIAVSATCDGSASCESEESVTREEDASSQRISGSERDATLDNESNLQDEPLASNAADCSVPRGGLSEPVVEIDGVLYKLTALDAADSSSVQRGLSESVVKTSVPLLSSPSPSSPRPASSAVFHPSSSSSSPCTLR
eukprot:Selendium_serpulae@DN5917_c4_g1_i1.p1